MKTINNFIVEKLKINSKSKINTTRYLSKDDMPSGFLQNFQCKNSKDLDKIEKNINLRKQTPQEIINKITYKEQLFCYWYLAVTNGWEEGYDIFRQEIINKEYATEDELDANIINSFETFKFDKKIRKNLQNYLDKYDIKIKNEEFK